MIACWDKEWHYIFISSCFFRIEGQDCRLHSPIPLVAYAHQTNFQNTTLSTLATMVAGNSGNLSPNSATVTATVAEFGNRCRNQRVSSHFAQSHFAQWDSVRALEVGVGVRVRVRDGVRVRRWDWAKWGRNNRRQCGQGLKQYVRCDVCLIVVYIPPAAENPSLFEIIHSPSIHGR